MPSASPITISTFVAVQLEIVWKAWIRPVHIKKWNTASSDWYMPFAKNNLHVGGTFKYRMEARDGSFGFDFEGKFLKIETETLIEYVLEDGRRVSINFEKEGEGVRVTETFELEKQNSIEFQTQDWQSVLDNFKKYVEAL